MLPSLRSPVRRSRSPDEQDEEKETDTEVLQRDVVEVTFIHQKESLQKVALFPLSCVQHVYVCTILSVDVTVPISPLLHNIHSITTQGLLNMQLLHRLRYILEVCRPPSLTVTETLEVIVRVARHSLNAASQVHAYMYSIREGPPTPVHVYTCTCTYTCICLHVHTCNCLSLRPLPGCELSKADEGHL